MKECIACNQVKPLSEFYKDQRRRDKHSIYCKSCWADKYASSDEQKLARRLAVKKHWDANSGTPEFRAKRRKNQLKYLYGLSIEDFERLLVEQDYRCKICREEFSESNGPRVDHDHACCKSNKSCGTCIRGLLCNRCNRMIGHVNEDISILSNAITYLRGGSNP